MRAAAAVMYAFWSLASFVGAPSVALEPTPTTGVSAAVDLSGPWTVQVEDPQHQVMTTLTVLFTGDKAVSCLSGDWKRVSVLAFKSSDKKFFPSDELSYEVRSGNIVIGRNSVCDAYLHLIGKLGTNPIKGDYIQFGWGSRNLGHFTLTKGS